MIVCIGGFRLMRISIAPLPNLKFLLPVWSPLCAVWCVRSLYATKIYKIESLNHFQIILKPPIYVCFRWNMSHMIDGIMRCCRFGYDSYATATLLVCSVRAAGESWCAASGLVVKFCIEIEISIESNRNWHTTAGGGAYQLSFWLNFHFFVGLGAVHFV